MITAALFRLALALTAASGDNCAPNPQAPVPCGGTLVGLAYSSEEPGVQHVGWMCPDYTVHWTKGDVADHYRCVDTLAKQPKTKRATMTKD